MKFQDNQHFSHNHILNAQKLDTGKKIDCNACENPITEPFHGCYSCNYYLHDQCLNIPRSLQHTSHPSHPLTLLPKSTYSSKSFSCDACGSNGNAFSFSCAHCEFDLHIHCAKLPAKILLENHPHELNLLFDFPNEDEAVFFECDICQGNMNRDRWLYYCADCDFAAHLNCTTGEVARKEGSNSSSNEYLKESANRKVEGIQAFDEAQEMIMAARIEAQLRAQGRNAALDLIDSGSHRRKYYY